MSDVTISGVETYPVANPWKPWVFVEVETDAGVTGFAEATAHDKPRTIAKAVEEMSSYSAGRVPSTPSRSDWRCTATSGSRKAS